MTRKSFDKSLNQILMRIPEEFHSVVRNAVNQEISSGGNISPFHAALATAAGLVDDLIPAIVHFSRNCNR